MRFLVVIVAILLERTSDSLRFLQNDNWYRRWEATLNKVPGLAGIPGIRLAISLAVPVIALAVAVIASSDWMFGLPLLIINLMVVLYCFGRGDLDAQVKTYTDALRRGDEQAAYHDAAAFNISEEEGKAVNWLEFHRDTLRALTYRFFERDMVVIFWFLIAGPAGALLYRLLFLSQEKGSEKETQLAGRWLLALEWLPVRLAGLTFALVGNFAGCMEGLRRCAGSLECSSGEVLRLCVEGALGESIRVGDRLEPDEEALEVVQIRQLFDRALVFWLCVAAATELLSIF